jgi:hypothetical protein
MSAKLFDPNRFRPQPKPEKQVKAKKPLSKKPTTEFGALMKKADEVHSKFIRQYYADVKGEVKCFTCPNKAHWKKMHCGHFINRNIYILRYEFFNTAPQCIECNIVKRGNIEEFEKQIDYTHGKGTSESLKTKAKEPGFKLTSELLKEIIEHRKIINR